MARYGCGTGVCVAPESTETPLQRVEWSCQMLPGVYPLANFWSLAFRIMMLLTGWQVADTPCIEIASGFMGTLSYSPPATA